MNKHYAPDSLIPDELISSKVLLIRGNKEMLDADLADLYGVVTKSPNQAVKRNLDRFPSDFMFRLTNEETMAVNQSQIVTGLQKHRPPRDTWLATKHNRTKNSTTSFLLRLYTIMAFQNK